MKEDPKNSAAPRSGINEPGIPETRNMQLYQQKNPSGYGSREPKDILMRSNFRQESKPDQAYFQQQPQHNSSNS